MAIPDNCVHCNSNISLFRSIGDSRLVEFHISGECKQSKSNTEEKTKDKCFNCQNSISKYNQFCSSDCEKSYYSGLAAMKKDEEDEKKLQIELVESGLRYNEGKRNWHLVPFESLEEFVKVLEFGATKYAPFNWQKGLSFSEIFDSLMRHAISWINGEDNDKETNLNHMAHIICNAVFLIHFQRNIDCYRKFDDRWDGISTPKAERKENEL